MFNEQTRYEFKLNRHKLKPLHDDSGETLINHTGFELANYSGRPVIYTILKCGQHTKNTIKLRCFWVTLKLGPICDVSNTETEYGTGTHHTPEHHDRLINVLTELRY